MVTPHRDLRSFPSHAEADDGGFVDGSPADRLALVWELTRDAWLFLGTTDPDQPLQRDREVLIRPDPPDPETKT
jgi:hypothetical protein